ncbi:MAG: hypothetical protein AB7S26_35320 [Sandaracinaceae bacterium]
MTYRRIAAILLVQGLVVACQPGLICGAGTVEREGECVAAPVDGSTTVDAATTDAGAGLDAALDDGSVCAPARCPSLLNADAACDGDRCVYACRTGYEDCDGTMENGCEADLSVPETCGSCAQECPTAGHAIATCSARMCGLVCAEGWDDCDGNPLSGCESLLIDAYTCGACGTSCSSTQICSGGTCTAPPIARWAYTPPGGASNSARVIALDDGGAIVVAVFSLVPYIARLSSTGTTVWSRPINSVAAPHLNDIAVRGNDIFVTGDHLGTTTFGPLTVTPPDTIQYHAFVATLTMDGTWSWARSYGNAGVLHQGIALLTEPSGDLLVAVQYGNGTDFGLGPLPSGTGTPPAGVQEGILRLTSTGDVTAQLGTTERSRGFQSYARLAASPDGSIYFVGNGGMEVMIGTHTVGTRGLFLAKLDASLGVIWVQDTGSVSAPAGLSALDDGVVLALPAPGIGGFPVGAAGVPERAVVAYAGDGTPRWARTFGPEAYFDRAAVDAAGRVYVAMYRPFGGTPAGQLVVLNRDGNHLWSLRSSGSSSAYVNLTDVSIAASGRAVVAGLFTTDVYFAPFRLMPGDTFNHAFYVSFEPL